MFILDLLLNLRTNLYIDLQSHVDNKADAYELLEAINDVLTWFCLDQPEARFCRTVVLSGFTLSDTQVEGDEIAEANNRFDALVALGKNGMLGTYEHSEKSAMDITTCSNTYLLIQTYQPARDDINQLPEVDLSETCAQMGACWKSMRYCVTPVIKINLAIIPLTNYLFRLTKF